MAVSAPVWLSAARGDELAPSPIVFAPVGVVFGVGARGGGFGSGKRATTGSSRHFSDQVCTRETRLEGQK